MNIVYKENTCAADSCVSSHLILIATLLKRSIIITFHGIESGLQSLKYERGGK